MSFRPYAPWGVALLVPATVLVGSRWGAGAGVLVAASGALALALGLLYRSVGALLSAAGAGTVEVELEPGETVALEHEKAALLRTLKDLEYERAVGKISEEDFQSAGKQYRARAVEVLAHIDRDLAPWRKKAEQAIAKRLTDAPPAAAPRAEESARLACAVCGTELDPDSVFCKKCGKKVSPDA